jgi:integrase
MAKYSYFLKNKNSDTETPIVLNINWTNNGVKKRLKFYINETILPKYWQTDKTKSGYQRATNTTKIKENAELNSRLDNIISTTKNVFRTYQNDNNQKQPTPEALKELLNSAILDIKENSFSFFDFFRKFIDESKIKTNTSTGRTTSSNTIKNYNNTFNHLKDFERVKKKRIDFDTIDLDFYHNLNDYLTNSKQHSINTIGGIIKIVKTVLNDATDRGVNTNLSFMSKRFKVITQKTDNVYLTEDELNELYHLDLSHTPRLERVKDLFLIGCFTGLRFSDFSKIQPKNIQGGYIHIETQKTGEKVVIPLHPKVDALFKKYNNNIPPAISNQKMNSYLKEIGKIDKKELKILKDTFSIKTTKGGLTVHTNYKKYDLISSHTARRSFATNTYLAGVPPFVIMGVTGHKTEKSFFSYIKITSNEKAKILEMYINKNNNLKAV